MTIINVGGRTDIVNYFTPWLLKRLEEGFCYSRNPLFPSNVYKIDLHPEKVDCLMFCSKNYKPILPYIGEINKKYRILCHYTITAYGKNVEPNVPNIDESIETLIKLSEIVGKEKIIWRYDPLLFTKNYDADKLIKTYEYIASKVHNHIQRALFSFVEMYKKLDANMPEIIPFTQQDKNQLAKGIGEISKKYNIYIQTCGTFDSYEEYGIHKSGCTTKEVLEQANNVTYKNIKASGMRKGCRCIPSHDIGAYDTCLNGCRYCYATKHHDKVKDIIKQHNPESPLLIGYLKAGDKLTDLKQDSFILQDGSVKQLSLL